MCLAIPGKIIEIHGEEAMDRVGKIEFGGVMKDASLAYLPEANIGDYVIVHAGFAISLVDEKSAQEIFDTIAQLEKVDDGL